MNDCITPTSSNVRLNITNIYSSSFRRPMPIKAPASPGRVTSSLSTFGHITFPPVVRARLTGLYPSTSYFANLQMLQPIIGLSVLVTYWYVVGLIAGLKNLTGLRRRKGSTVRVPCPSDSRVNTNVSGRLILGICTLPGDGTVISILHGHFVRDRFTFWQGIYHTRKPSCGTNSAY